VDGNTRIDGLNSYSIMAYPMEAFDNLEVLNGAAGALYGASSPGGIFDFVLKRPTETPFQEYTLGYDSGDTFTEHVELGGHIDDDHDYGYRINLMHGNGESYVKGSNVQRDLIAGDFDIRLDPQTVVQLDGTYYVDNPEGFPAAVVYGTTAANAQVPAPIDPGKYGYGVIGAGQTLTDYNGVAKLKHDFDANWKLTLGALYQYSARRLNPNGVLADPYVQIIDAAGDYASYVADSGLHTEVESDLGYFNGHFETGSIAHDIVLGTNGYEQLGHTRLGQTYSLGDASLDNPVEYVVPAYTKRGIFYKSSWAGQQAIVAGDTITFDPQWSMLASGSQTWLTSVSYSAAGKVTADYNANAFSPTLSVVYKPLPDITTYLTYADALQQGDTAPTTGVTNPGQVLAPYRSREYEAGVKTTLDGRLDLGADVFRMSRPYALTNPSDDTFEDIGRQVNYGFELTAKGNLFDNFTVFGGLTWLDPELTDTNNPATNDKLVISVPRYQANLYAEYRLPRLPGLAVDANLHYTGNRAGNVNNTTWLGSYTTTDLGVRYALLDAANRRFTVRFGVDNVFDVHYWAATLPAAQNGVSANYAAFPGTPRIFHLSVSVDQ
jgi:iron complex outermembrane receptor protein